jgi:hypothetical protein
MTSDGVASRAREDAALHDEHAVAVRGGPVQIRRSESRFAKEWT